MQWRNSVERYGAVHQIFHWLMALLIIGMLIFGFILTELPLNPDTIKLYGIHKATGIVILILVGLRLCWRLVNVIPPLPEHTPLWQKLAANASHYALYALMIAMPVSGWLVSSAAGFPVSVYGWFLMPDLVGKDDAMRKFYAETHELLAWALIAVASMHAAAALMHHFVYKDNILRRMLPGRKQK